jgi:putative colanic acid biosynthesis UDP-glucose lipid carrier transferase
MNSRNQSLHKTFFAFSDLLALNVINLALLSYIDKYTTNFYLYTIFCLFSNIVWMICAYASAMYVNKRLSNFRRLASRTLGAFIFFNCFLWLFASTSLHQITNSYILFDQCGFAFFLLFSRISYILFMSYLFKTDEHRKKIAFIGCNKHVKTLIDHFRESRKSTIIAGVFDDKYQPDQGIPLLGSIKDCVSYAKANKITEIYSTLSPKRYPSLHNLANSAEKSFIKFKFVPDLTEFSGNKCQVDFIEDTAVISLRNEPLADISGQIKKRAFDVAISSLVLLFILSWLIPILAILIKFDSKGPVFFTQLRSGKNNIPFKVFKLRTLRENVDADNLQVTRGDGRITKLGRFLRKTNLDELPQFFNVLAGDMSIVGSRPHMLKHTTEYSQLYDNYMLRHYTKPGITGWAQVNGYRGEIKEPNQLRKRVEHDIWYTENWNIWLDFKIVALTAIKTLCGDENAF